MTKLLNDNLVPLREAYAKLRKVVGDIEAEDALRRVLRYRNLGQAAEELERIAGSQKAPTP